jgi:hypothetical protein
MLPTPAIRSASGLRARLRSAVRRVDAYMLWAFNPPRGR